MQITTLAALRTIYPEPRERALRKQLDRLDRHCLRFIELAPFVVVASASAAGHLDASPRGGAPGFVKAPDEHTLLLPDAPGNHRLDSLSNVVETGEVGLLFMIPGVDETLRVNGPAQLSREAADIAACADERRAPKLVLRVTVRDAYLHCPKAYMRSRLWDPASRVERSVLPTLGQMINDQSGIDSPPETQEEMVRRYTPDL